MVPLLVVVSIGGLRGSVTSVAAETTITGR